jgi:hypothetical protein
MSLFFTVVYGSSDDLIEMDGDYREEHGAYGDDTWVGFSDGTVIKATYDGTWMFEGVAEPWSDCTVVGPLGEDSDTEHVDVPRGVRVKGYSGYVVIEPDEKIVWSETFRECPELPFKTAAHQRLLRQLERFSDAEDLYDKTDTQVVRVGDLRAILNTIQE